MRYQIQTGVDNRILRTKSLEVEKITSDIRKFCDILLKLMYEQDGVGLAAPQIGENIRIIATTERKGRKEIKNRVMINPRITERSKAMIIQEEACLSLPKVSGKVKRHQSVVVEYLDTKGTPQSKKLTNLNAVIIQHEIDHLDGVLFIDKAIPKTIISDA